MKHIAIINGPNLNLLGTREPVVYGTVTMEQYLETLRPLFSDRCEIHYFQSNVEGDIINKLQSCIGKMDGIVLNAGGYTHTSVAIADAITAVQLPVIEVHVSNILAREEYRRHSVISSKCQGSISGLGLNGYSLAISHLLA